jgi:hypothetical protein
MKKRIEAPQTHLAELKATAADQQSNTGIRNVGTGAALVQATSRLVRLLNGEGLITEQTLRERLKEHVRSNPSHEAEAEAEEVLRAFRRMLNGAPYNAAGSSRDASTPARLDKVSATPGACDTEPAMCPTSGPDFMERVMRCWLDVIEESVEAIAIGLALIDDLIDMIEASAPRLPPEEIDDHRRRAQQLLEGYMGELAILQREVNQIASAVGLRQPGVEASRLAALTHAGAPA